MAEPRARRAPRAAVRRLRHAAEHGVSAGSRRAHPIAALPAQTGLLYQVNTTGDAAGIPPLSRCDTDLFTPGAQCTLRAALQATNAVTGEDTITFNIPATDPGCDSATGSLASMLNTNGGKLR